MPGVRDWSAFAARLPVKSRPILAAKRMFDVTDGRLTIVYYYTMCSAVAAEGVVNLVGCLCFWVCSFGVSACSGYAVVGMVVPVIWCQVWNRVAIVAR